MEKLCNSTQRSLGPQHHDNLLWSNVVFTCCSHADILIDVVMHGQGRVTWRTTRFLLRKLLCQSFCISTCLDYDYLERYRANARNTYRRIQKSYCSRPVHTKRCYWAVILERIESRTLESHESLECLVCQVCQCLSWKTYTCCKKQNLKSETKLHILYAIYWTTLLPWDWRT